MTLLVGIRKRSEHFDVWNFETVIIPSHLDIPVFVRPLLPPVGNFTQV